MHYEVFLGKDSLYYFRFVAANGQIIATSGDGYALRCNCIYALNLLKQYAAVSPVYNK